MKLENQVCSLELAQKLKELGVKQESLFSYIDWYGNKIWQLKNSTTRGKTIPSEMTEVSAYTVAELGEMLPQVVDFPDPVDIPENADTKRLKESPEGRIRLEEMRYRGLLSTSKPNGWFVYYKGFKILDSPYRISATDISGKDNTEADARAKVLIYLLENKLITTPHG
jgi:hypothetical protein